MRRRLEVRKLSWMLNANQYLIFTLKLPELSL